MLSQAENKNFKTKVSTEDKSVVRPSALLLVRCRSRFFSKGVGEKMTGDENFGIFDVYLLLKV